MGKTKTKGVGLGLDPSTYSSLSLYCLVNEISKRQVTSKAVESFLGEQNTDSLIKRLINKKQEEWELIKINNTISFEQYKNDTRSYLKSLYIDPDVISKVMIKLKP